MTLDQPDGDSHVDEREAWINLYTVKVFSSQQHIYTQKDLREIYRSNLFTVTFKIRQRWLSQSRSREIIKIKVAQRLLTKNN